MSSQVHFVATEVPVTINVTASHPLYSQPPFAAVGMFSSTYAIFMLSSGIFSFRAIVLKELSGVAFIFICGEKGKLLHLVPSECEDSRKSQIHVLDNMLHADGLKDRYGDVLLYTVKSTFLRYMKKANHPNVDILNKCKLSPVQMPWRTENNVIDYGVLVM
ncbi:hypothetical protein Tco_0511904 [Tanacetum coccineum]